MPFSIQTIRSRNYRLCLRTLLLIFGFADNVKRSHVGLFAVAAYCGSSCGEVGTILAADPLKVNNSMDCTLPGRAREFQTLH